MTASEPRLPDDFSDVEEINRGSGRLRVALEIGVAFLVLVGIYFLFAPEEEIGLPPLPQKEIDPIIRAQIDAAQGEQSAPAPAIEATNSSPGDPGIADDDAPTTANTATQQLPDGEAAREIIADLRGGGEQRPLSEIDRLARDYQLQGRLTDAYLLWFFAARQGNGEAAFALASLYDPNRFKPGNSLVTAADANQAYKWYRTAAQQSIPQAAERLQALRASLAAQAKAGDVAARRLLLNWQ